MIGEGSLDLFISIIISILVVRIQGDSALGIFSYFLSFYLFAGFISEFGITKFLERETAFNSNDVLRKTQYYKSYKAVILFSIFCAAIIVITSFYSASLTVLNENISAYVIIAFTIPLQNINKLRIAYINGTGKHEEAAKFIIKKRIAILVIFFVLLIFHLPASFLVIGFFFTELYLFIKMTKANKGLFPGTRTSKGHIGVIKQIMSGYRYLLSGETLNIVFYLDYLILGMFVTSEQIGLYAKAVILTRCFLVVPLSIRPIFRKLYCSLASENDQSRLKEIINRSTVLLFYLQSVLALYILLYFPSILNILFGSRNGLVIPFTVFVTLLPGLLYFSTYILQEPLYEAVDAVINLRTMVITVSVVNLLLNIYLVPFAGIQGAAFATAGAMFVYFYLFGRDTMKNFQLNKILYIIAGAVLYVTYIVLEYLNMSFLLTIWLSPLLLFLFYTLINLFNRTIFTENKIQILKQEGV